MNKSQPPSYTFKTDPSTDGAKYYWSFGDNTNSDSPSPTHTFKTGDTYVVQVKIVKPDGKVCYGEVKARFEGGTVTTAPNILSGKGKVKRPAITDGCRLLIYLENGTAIVPVEIVPVFEFKDGQYVELAYELLKDKPSGCNTGISAKIHRIAEITVPSVCKAPITFIKNADTPVSYTFSTETQPTDSKFYWYFGDGGMSELASPTYVFKKAGTWVVTLKIVDKAGKVCYGETKATFEGETNPPLSARGKVKKTEASGCSLVIATDNSILIPAKIATDFQLREGQYVEFTYEKFAEKVTDCKEGTDVKILTIREIQAAPACKFEIVVKPKEGTLNTYLFYAVSQAEIKTWKWNFGDGKVLKGAEVNYNFENDGIYDVTLKAVSGNDFSEYTQQVEILKSVTRTQIIDKPEPEVYPNPVNDRLIINFGNPVEGTILIEIMNIAGQLAYTQELKTEGLIQTAINVHHLK